MNLQSWNSEISDAEHAIYPVEVVEKQANRANRCSKETESRTARQINLFRSGSKATMQECEARIWKMKGGRIIRQTRFQFPNIRRQVFNAILLKIHIFTSFKIFDSLFFLRCKKISNFVVCKNTWYFRGNWKYSTSKFVPLYVLGYTNRWYIYCLVGEILVTSVANRRRN